MSKRVCALCGHFPALPGQTYCASCLDMTREELETWERAWPERISTPTGK